MRSLFIAFAVLAASALPLTASADPVDYFTLTGNGNTYTWSLPANETYPAYPHLGYIVFPATVTTNGTAQTTGDIGFYTSAGIAGPDLYVPGINDALYGQWLANIGPGPTGYVSVTFDLGTFDLTDEHFGPSFGPPPPPTPYTLTVTQQAATTPEPSSLALLGTGILGVAGVLKRRLAR